MIIADDNLKIVSVYLRSLVYMSYAVGVNLLGNRCI